MAYTPTLSWMRLQFLINYKKIRAKKQGSSEIQKRAEIGDIFLYIWNLCTLLVSKTDYEQNVTLCLKIVYITILVYI